MELSRRRFLAGAAGLALWPRKAVSANDRIVVAHIGVGGMGNAHVSWFAGFADVETAAVCDCDSARAAAALEGLRQARADTRAVAETDFRRLLDRPDIDVITYATPDHWHALNAILAFQAGKHVYGEKPLSYSWREAEAMLRTQRRYDRVFQLGTQIHAGENYHRVVEIVRSGALGRIHTVNLWKVGGETAAGFPPDGDPPETLNWDMWLGPAPWRPYNPALQPFQFRYHWDYSGGVFADFWCHVADLAAWALPEQWTAPRTIAASGRDPLDHLVTTPPFMDAEFEFPDLKVTWSSRVPEVRGANGRGLGIHFAGSEGELVADYGSRVIFIGDEPHDDLPDVPQSLPRSPGHQRGFLDCVRSGGQPESHLDYAVRMTLPMYLACIAYRLGRTLTWDAERSQFADDEAANRMLHRPYRAPWSLPG